MKIIKYIAYPFAVLYGGVVTVRNFFFDIGVLPSKKFPFWVVSVGNLSAGGTGKSPHVEYIARLLDRLTGKYENLDTPLKKIGVLSRGYGRVNKGFLLANNSSNALGVGDEPVQLKRRLPEVYVGVDAHRVRGISILMGLNPQIRIILLDDAFQHRYVKPMVSVLLTNYNTPFYNDTMLPSGMLREPKRGAKRAQLIVVTNVPANITDIEKKLILKNINPKSHQKVFFSSIIYETLLPVYKGNYITPVIDKNCSVLLLTGIANAHSLYNHVAEMARDVIHVSFPDHHIFKTSDIVKAVKSFNAITNPNKVIITTEKDSMRLQLGELEKDFGLAPVFYIPISVKVHEEEEFEDALIAGLNKLKQDKPIRKL